MSCLCDLFFIFGLIFIAINLIKSDALAFCTFFRISLSLLDDNVDKESKHLAKRASSASCCLAFAFAYFFAK